MSSTGTQPKRFRHDVEWDDQKIGEFWGVASEVYRDQFFSRRAGGVFLDIAKKHLGH